MKINIIGNKYEPTEIIACNIIRFLKYFEIKVEIENIKELFEDIDAGLKDSSNEEALRSIIGFEIDKEDIIKLNIIKE